MNRIYLFSMSCVLLMACGCASSVAVTKTAKEYFPPTNPDEVEILVTIPDRGFIELATVTTQNWWPYEAEKMHKSLRAKCAPLGANAVILESAAIDPYAYFSASGVAIRYKD